MKDPVVTFKHFEFLYGDTLFKIKTHSKDMAFAIFKSHFPEVESEMVTIETVNAAFFQTLDCQELKEDEV